MAEIYYKYRDAKNMSRIASIIREGKLWASTYKELNDPMEWYFRSKDKTFDQNKLNEYKRDARICCVSKSCNYGLMWSMYADEHRGVCIEFSIDDMENCKDNEPLSEGYWRRYTVEYKNAPTEIKDYPNVDEVLGVKSPQWMHEQEVRFVRKCETGTPCFIKIKVSKIYLGLRMTAEDKALIYGLKAYLEKDFEIIDLVALNDVVAENVGVNYWNNYKGEVYTNINSKKPIGFTH